MTPPTGAMAWTLPPGELPARGRDDGSRSWLAWPRFQKWLRPGVRRSFLLSLLVGVLVFATGTGWDRLHEPGDTDAAVDATVLAFFGPDLQLLKQGDFGVSQLQVLDGEVGLADALRVTYPRGSASPLVARQEHAPLGGAQMYLKVRRQVLPRAQLSYLMRLPTGFDFARGGLLPGLYGGAATANRATATKSSGFSTRLGWRQDGTGLVSAYSTATAVDASTRIGEGRWTWPVGRWVCVTQEVVLNRVGRPDGRLRVWLDRTPVLDEQHLLLRDRRQVHVDGVFFSTFFGGADSSYASPHEQHIDFAGVAVARDTSGCPHPGPAQADLR